MLTLIRPALSLLLIMTLLTGVAYPLAVTAVARLAFSSQAGGSLVHDAQGQVRGSALLAQNFTGPEWFQPRPSAGDFATVSSAASNLASTNPALASRVQASAAQVYSPADGPVPMALLTTSASGLDPDLPPAAVLYQVARVAKARGLAEAQVHTLAMSLVRQPLFGPPVVNVLGLNLALDQLTSAR
jgi:K+-transporting ATPase ATPase C chain